MKTLIRCATVAGTGLAALIMVTTAFGHAAYVSSTPAKGAVLQSAPTSVQITFAQAMQKGSANFDIAVAKDGGGSATSGAATVDAVDAQKGTVPLKPNLASGRYVVNWHNVSSEDGDPAEGAFSFYVSVQPTAADLAKDADLEAFGREAEATPTAAPAPATQPTASAPAPVSSPVAAAPAPSTSLPRTGDGTAADGQGLPWQAVVVVAAGILIATAGIAARRPR